jgi:hypothetical protein
MISTVTHECFVDNVNFFTPTAYENESLHLSGLHFFGLAIVYKTSESYCNDEGDLF